jgi:hypothetical protein
MFRSVTGASGFPLEERPLLTRLLRWMSLLLARNGHAGAVRLLLGVEQTCRSGTPTSGLDPTSDILGR